MTTDWVDYWRDAVKTIQNEDWEAAVVAFQRAWYSTEDKGQKATKMSRRLLRSVDFKDMFDNWSKNNPGKLPPATGVTFLPPMNADISFVATPTKSPLGGGGSCDSRTAACIIAACIIGIGLLLSVMKLYGMLIR
jgi:hypothetical protein